MYKDWLQKKVTVEEVEAAHTTRFTEDVLQRIPHLNEIQNVPFGYQNKYWLILLSKMQEGDELWEFNSPERDWANLAGRCGVVLMRDGEEVYSIVSGMN